MKTRYISTGSILSNHFKGISPGFCGHGDKFERNVILTPLSWFTAAIFVLSMLGLQFWKKITIPYPIFLKSAFGHVWHFFLSSVCWISTQAYLSLANEVLFGWSPEPKQYNHYFGCTGRVIQWESGYDFWTTGPTWSCFVWWTCGFGVYPVSCTVTFGHGHDPKIKKWVKIMNEWMDVLKLFSCVWDCYIWHHLLVNLHHSAALNKKCHETV